MARTSKDTKAAARSAATEQSSTSTMSTTGQTWAPASGTPASGRSTVSARPGGLGIGSPIYEELVAELGDPAA